MSDGPENNSSPPGKDLALPLLLPGRPRVHPRPGRTFFLGNDPLGSGHTKKEWCETHCPWGGQTVSFNGCERRLDYARLAFRNGTGEINAHVKISGQRRND